MATRFPVDLHILPNSTAAELLAIAHNPKLSAEARLGAFASLPRCQSDFFQSQATFWNILETGDASCRIYLYSCVLAGIQSGRVEDVIGSGEDARSRLMVQLLVEAVDDLRPVSLLVRAALGDASVTVDIESELLKAGLSKRSRQLLQRACDIRSEN